MKILVAPNAFKGTLSAHAASHAIATGLRAARDDLQIVELPVADGGDGSLAVVLLPAQLERCTATITGVLGQPQVAAYGFRARDGLACIEVAQACGFIAGPSPGIAHPAFERTTTFGVGELVRHALAHGAQAIDFFIGGTATVDGGLGMLQALGAEPVAAGAAPLAAPLRSGDVTRVVGLRRGIAPTGLGKRVPCRALCDVTNPLCGPNGAAQVFGPQKGATPAIVAALDAALARLYGAREPSGQTCRMAGGGAGGGLAAAAHVFLGATLHPGADAVLDLVGFDAALVGVDWVVTGEGSLDLQTLAGKAPAAVLRRAERAAVRVAALVGTNTLPDDAGFAFVHAMGPAGMADPVGALQAAARYFASTLP